MGFFSWRTQDTGKSICNAYSERQTFKVVMTDDKGNQWVENSYEGYGIFDGKDYHELADEMNGGKGDRNKGIDMFFSENKENYIFPSLSQSGKYYNGKAPKDCKYQGYFY